ncbi:DUF6098 family protein [Actinoplanes sp. NPDC023801]|uniref:DUF6098 family protein n=1 Tax=Actinoplanes sp. NPDC023801 TaxID=3154595 RepID=UPI0033E820D4
MASASGCWSGRRRSAGRWGVVIGSPSRRACDGRSRLPVAARANRPHEPHSGGNPITVARYEDLPTMRTLDELVALAEGHPDRRDLYVRWSRGPDLDLADAASSRDSLTGVPLPGLSANSLAVEEWWKDRPARLWVARRLYDYRHLQDLRGAGTRPWVLAGDVCGRGPDNEPLVRCRGPVAWISDAALRESRELVESQGSPEWGPLDRRTRA